LKILIDGRLIADRETGISRYTEELLKIYIDLFDEKNIILLLDRNLKKEFKGIKVVKTELYPFNIVDFMKFRNLLKTIDFNVYHSMFYSNSFFKLKDKIYITTVHDLMYKLVPNFFKKNNLLNKLAMVYFDFIVKKSLKNSDFVVSVSNTTKDDVKKVFEKDSIVITEGINELKTIDMTLKIDKKVIKSNEYFLYVGNNRPHKNVDFLKKCYLEDNTNKKLVIVGHKGERECINNKDIIYIGYINDFTLKYLYENASAFVFPSLYEGFGLPILEAINLNTLVLSSNNGSLREFGEYNIQYFNPKIEESLVNLIEDIDNMEFDYLMKEELLSRFNWNTVKYQLEKFYKENLYETN